MEQSFKIIWNENQNKNVQPVLENISSIEILLSKADSIHHDPFDNMNADSSVVETHTTSRDENDNFEAELTLYSGVYHFLFRIMLENGDEYSKFSSDYRSTTLGNGRRINYIEIGAPSPESVGSFSDCK